MLDDVEFTEALLAHPNDMQTALAFYEAAFPRSEATADESNHNLSINFQPDAPQGMLNLMAQYARQEK